MFVQLTTRPRLLVAVVGCAVLGVLVGHPTLARSLGVDVWNALVYEEQLRECRNQRVELDAETDDLLRRITLKRAMIAELVAGRTTLDDVTERFPELSSTHPQSLKSLRESYPGATDREKTARKVISYALEEVPDECRGALAAKLYGELERMSAHSAAP